MAGFLSPEPDTTVLPSQPSDPQPSVSQQTPPVEVPASNSPQEKADPEGVWNPWGNVSTEAPSEDNSSLPQPAENFEHKEILEALTRIEAKIDGLKV